MNEAGFLQVAEALVFVHGRDAAREAAFQAKICDGAGNRVYAATWRQVELAVLSCANLKAA